LKPSKLPTGTVLVGFACVAHHHDRVARLQLCVQTLEVKLLQSVADLLRAEGLRLERAPTRARLNLFDRFERLRLFVGAGTLCTFVPILSVTSAGAPGVSSRRKQSGASGGHSGFEAVADELREPQNRVALRCGAEPELICDPLLIKDQNIGQGGPPIEQRDREIVRVASR